MHLMSASWFVGELTVSELTCQPVGLSVKCLSPLRTALSIDRADRSVAHDIDTGACVACVTTYNFLVPNLDEYTSTYSAADCIIFVF